MKQAPEKTMDTVHDYRSHLNSGCIRTAEALARDPENSLRASALTARRVFREHDLFLSYPHRIADIEHTKRFAARHMGQLWHTDLRSFKVSEDGEFEYMMAFIDNRSHRTVSREVLPNTTMISTSEVLECALTQPRMLVPHAMTIENLSE